MIIVLIILIAIVIWVIAAYNGFVKGENAIDEAFATMDVYLKKRSDLIPNLVETVKGYAKHEADTLDAVIKARNAANNANGADAKIAAENEVTGALRHVFALAEAYPDLKANTNYQELMKQLEGTENDIANARKYYNAVVKNFNVRLQSFPSSIIGSIFHYQKKAMYEAEDAERSSVAVDFGTSDAADVAADVTELTSEAPAVTNDPIPETQEVATEPASIASEDSTSN